MKFLVNLKIPLHEVREIYEGPAEMEMFEGTQREYVAPDVGCATGVCTTTCAPVGGVAAGGYATGGFATGGYRGRWRNRLFRGPRVGAGTTVTN